MKAEERIIFEQRNEIRRLRRENRRLRHYADSAGVSDRHPETPGAALLASMTHDSRIVSISNYPKYLYLSLCQSSPYRIWTRIMAYFRRFRFLSFAFHAAAQIIAIIETSAILLVASTIFIVMIPVMLGMLVGTLVAALTRGRALNRYLREELRNKRVFIFFPTSSPAPGYGSVMHATVEGLAVSRSNVIFVVSPHTVSSCIFGERHMFFMARNAEENVFYIRKFYYFLLRRRVLCDMPERVSVIF